MSSTVTQRRSFYPIWKRQRILYKSRPLAHRPSRQALGTAYLLDPNGIATLHIISRAKDTVRTSAHGPMPAYSRPFGTDTVFGPVRGVYDVPAPRAATRTSRHASSEDSTDP